MTRVGWVDCSSGVSGDMVLGALSELGALGELPAMLASLRDLNVGCAAVPVTRQGVGATSFRVTAGPEQPLRQLADVLLVVDRADVPEPVREQAARVFRRLADAEAAAHRSDPADVHFHEVGAVDSIVDVLAGCLGLHALRLDEIVASPVALGGGSVATSHGQMPVPTPATLGLLANSGLVGHGGPADVELATPTGVALLAEWVTSCGPMPTMSIESIGVGAGERDLAEHANVVRIVVGSASERDSATAPESDWWTVEANVDDLDPRLWPGVLDQLLAAGAADAWLTPILMKKGRPAHVVSALVATGSVDAVRQILVAETSTIGVRMTAVTKRALARSWLTVDVDGQTIRVKLAHDGDRRRNLAPEFDDVAAAAAALAAPVKEVLARATAAALRALDTR